MRRENVAGKSGKWTYVVLSFFVVTTVQAAPTINQPERDVAIYSVSLSHSGHILLPPSPETIQIGKAYNPHIASIAAEFLKPPAYSINAPALPAHASPLPGVPGALFMALTGFLCVSLVKDRKLWMTALAGLLWASQAGFAVLPQLASQIVSKKQIEQRVFLNLTHSELEHLDRLRSDIEDTQYIGLLHHLAGIPDSTVLLPASLSSLRAQRSNLITSFKCVVSARTKSNPAAPQFAITHFSSLLNCPAICPAPRAELYIRFSPGFIFTQLPRGPPNPA